MLNKNNNFDINNLTFDEALSKYVKVNLKDLENIETNNLPLPFIKWVGGKRSIIEKLLEHIPQKFNDYYEPFVGGGALLYRIYEKANRCYISDINLELILTYKVIQNNLNELLKILEIHKKNHNKEYYNKIRALHNLKNPIEKSARFIYLNKTCFNGLYRVNKKGEFNSPIGDYKNPNILDIENLKACNKILQKVDIKLGQFLLIKPKENDLVYFDPPYHPTDNNSFTSYTANGFTEQNQISLRDFILDLTKKNVKIMLSNSNTNFINDLYKSKLFNIIIIDAPRMINCKANKRNPVKEVLIRNYK
jgi:DNA adenine methylase